MMCVMINDVIFRCVNLMRFITGNDKLGTGTMSQFVTILISLPSQVRQVIAVRDLPMHLYVCIYNI